MTLHSVFFISVSTFTLSNYGTLWKLLKLEHLHFLIHSGITEDSFHHLRGKVLWVSNKLMPTEHLKQWLANSKALGLGINSTIHSLGRSYPWSIKLLYWIHQKSSLILSTTYLLICLLVSICIVNIWVQTTIFFHLGNWNCFVTGLPIFFHPFYY